MAILATVDRYYTHRQFFLHRIRARRWDAFHSPSLFRLFTACCDEKLLVSGAEKLEKRRASWLGDDEMIRRVDFGAGSGLGENTTISDIARSALSKPFQCRFMARLVKTLKPNNIVEFGTSLGLSSAYMAMASPEAHIDTVEGDPAVAYKALNLFRQEKLDNISLHIMAFNDFLKEQELLPEHIDLLFLDGHHISTALYAYYEALHHLLHDESVVIVDDIYWSADMQDGWKRLICRPEITQSVDCFHFGLLFFGRHFKHKEHHTIRLPIKMLLT